MSGQLVKYDAACRAVAEAKTVDEAKAVRDEAERLELYAKQAKNRDLQADAIEITWLAERRMGELLVAAKKAGQVKRGNPTGRNGTKKAPFQKGTKEEPFHRVLLKQAGLDKRLSSRAQKLAAVPAAQFSFAPSTGRPRPPRSSEASAAGLQCR